MISTNFARVMEVDMVPASILGAFQDIVSLPMVHYHRFSTCRSAIFNQDMGARQSP